MKKLFFAFVLAFVLAMSGCAIASANAPQIVLNQQQFNALLLDSLQADDKGRQVLAVSDQINTTLSDGEIQIGALINLDKVEKVNAKARAIIEKLDNVLVFLEGSQMRVSLIVRPLARNGEIAIYDDFSAKVGLIPISNDALQTLGVAVQQANNNSLALKNLSLQSIKVLDGEVVMRAFRQE